MKITLLSAFFVLTQKAKGFIASNRVSIPYQTPSKFTRVHSSSTDSDIGSIADSRFPTSVDDQVRQATSAVNKAIEAGVKRHSIRLLLPLIGATELDDWPGGARQQMEAASPLMRTIVSQLGNDDGKQSKPKIQETIIDDNDGVRALFTIADDPKNDTCSILLPSAETVGKVVELDKQVGPSRNLLLVNTQWQSKSDFSFFGRDKQVNFVENFVPSFSLTSSMVEGDQIRVIRAYPGPWRVYVMKQKEYGNGEVDWIQIGTKPVTEKPDDEWTKNSKGLVFNHGKPTYQEIEVMIKSQEGYVPRSVTEKASAAFTFIKDTL